MNDLNIIERWMRFELTTFTLARWCSTNWATIATFFHMSKNTTKIKQKTRTLWVRVYKIILYVYYSRTKIDIRSPCHFWPSKKLIWICTFLFVMIINIVFFNKKSKISEKNKKVGMVGFEPTKLSCSQSRPGNLTPEHPDKIRTVFSPITPCERGTSSRILIQEVCKVSPSDRTHGQT